jgi:hypothetical protein
MQDDGHSLRKLCNKQSRDDDDDFAYEYYHNELSLSFEGASLCEKGYF